MFSFGVNFLEENDGLDVRDSSDAFSVMLKVYLKKSKETVNDLNFYFLSPV